MACNARGLPCREAWPHLSSCLALPLLQFETCLSLSVRRTEPSLVQFLPGAGTEKHQCSLKEWVNRRPARAVTLNEHHLLHFIIAGETIQGLRANLTNAIETLCGVDSSVAVSSGGELFLRFISLTSLEYSVSPALPQTRLLCVQTLL